MPYLHPLDKISEFRNYGYFIPSFVFDPLNVRSNDRFKNGYEHLKRDIENFDESFKTLNKMIEDYNHDLKEFETTGLENLITRYFEEHSFKVECYSKKQPSKNTVVMLSEFLRILKHFWREGTPFEYKFNEKDELVINGSISLITVLDGYQSKMTDCMEGLKEHEEILESHMNLIDRHNNIKMKADSLSEDIGKKLVIRIEDGVYNKDCEMCTKYINEG